MITVERMVEGLALLSSICQKKSLSMFGQQIVEEEDCKVRSSRDPWLSILKASIPVPPQSAVGFSGKCGI